MAATSLPNIGAELRYPAGAPRERQQRGWVAGYSGQAQTPLEVGFYGDGGRNRTALVAAGDVELLKIRRVRDGFQAIDLLSLEGELLWSLRLTRAEVQLIGSLAEHERTTFEEMFNLCLREGVEMLSRRHAQSAGETPLADVREADPPGVG